VLDFFETTSRNVLAAEAAAGVSHHVALSIVGTDRLDSAYFRAKLAQEEATRASTVPFTILRATQFFEFIRHVVDTSTDSDDTVRLPPVLIQPEAADDVAAVLADIATSAPRNDIVELAGPELFRLDQLAQRVLRAQNDPRRVTADVNAQYFAAMLDEHSLAPGENPRIAPTRQQDWLSDFTPSRRPPETI
jgi:uncharacterized protein YbjT (DUF2867 family)